MIRRLRLWHRAWFALLAILLPALLYLALRNRPHVPMVEALPEAGAGGDVTDERSRP